MAGLQVPSTRQFLEILTIVVAANFHLLTNFFLSKLNSSDHEELKNKMQINYAFKAKQNHTSNFARENSMTRFLGDLLS